MKELQFSTAHGNFILVDDEPNITKFIPWDLCELVGVVKDMTEEQFAEIVDAKPPIIMENDEVIPTYRNYLYHDIQAPHIWKRSAKDSFLSLVHSLGWYLWENPQGKHPDWRQYASTLQYQQHSMDWQEAESKTLYNPILLKKI